MYIPPDRRCIMCKYYMFLGSFFCSSTKWRWYINA